MQSLQDSPQPGDREHLLEKGPGWDTSPVCASSQPHQWRHRGADMAPLQQTWLTGCDSAPSRSSPSTGEEDDSTTRPTWRKYCSSKTPHGPGFETSLSMQRWASTMKCSHRTSVGLRGCSRAPRRPRVSAGDPCGATGVLGRVFRAAVHRWDQGTGGRV